MIEKQAEALFNKLKKLVPKLTKQRQKKFDELLKAKQRQEKLDKEGVDK